ncbi:hypothetical protein C448_02593 [Halococcus morrhuae DSM 1307]|uniref:Uncharacterized protein n=1 Tax=Halococcus morrhuae DSM 1307 TaxID=931277 RepID=M0MTQ5_HALMO|nr:hypothetical protein C448_02593 [Halococcus morrhuae DSM 1307]
MSEENFRIAIGFTGCHVSGDSSFRYIIGLADADGERPDDGRKYDGDADEEDDTDDRGNGTA